MSTPLQPKDGPAGAPGAGSRRDFLWRLGGGLGGIALAQMLGADRLLAETAPGAGTAPLPHHRPRARRVVQLFMSGAASQCDTFDYKPQLIARAGQKFDPGGPVELFQSDPGVVFKSPWDWRPRGRCGKRISDLVPHLGACADDIAFLHGMVSKSNVHGPATFMQATGFVLPGFPGMGAWVSYGLGSLNQNLPTFVVLPDARGFAPNGPANWGAGFLPATHQGTMIRAGQPNPIFNLFPPASAGFITPAAEREGLALIQSLNRDHAAQREGDSRLDARVASYELAARLQLSAPEVMDLRGETAATRRLYGVDEDRTRDFGTRCLIARRLLERGVRFVQVWSGADNGFPRRNWDSHEDLARDHLDMATSMDRGAAALLLDLKARGLLEDTIVLWTTEFGRMPCSQGSKGRDHNPFGFTNWLAGGGIRGGVSHGATDDWSYRAVEDVTYCYDVHATILHLLGLDHERLTFRHNGVDRRLTDVHGEVIRDILA
ncbi:MAG: hypothetical protein RJA22_107 [Verrucomicrobiota bacterium]|jgi:hypothetical protein